MTQLKIDGAGNKFDPADEIAAENADRPASQNSVTGSEQGSNIQIQISPDGDPTSAGDPDSNAAVSEVFQENTDSSRTLIDRPDDAGDSSSTVSTTGTELPAQPTGQAVAAVADNAVLNANVGDQPTLEDTLGFKPYVEAIASFLMNKVTKPPLTLSIEGEWGSGKSSFMLQLEAELRARNAKVVRFNAWRHDKDDAMWAAFAMQFTRSLSGELTWFWRWRAHGKLFFRRFNLERGWLDVARVLVMLLGLVAILLLPMVMWDRLFALLTASGSAGTSLGSELGVIIRAGGFVGYLGLLGVLCLKLKDVVGNPLTINLKQHLDTPDYRSRVAFIERFHEDFAKVVDVYGQNEKVCVFIDDLDRCEVPKAADLMQALNLMISDNSHLIFIMGMDREKVAAGLAVKYEKLLPYLAPAAAGKGTQGSASFDPVMGLEYGYTFIEKFIQLPFVVPQASEDQMKEFLEKVFGDDDRPPVRKLVVAAKGSSSGKAAEEAVTHDTEMIGDILTMIAPTFDYNPRQMKQFINAFRLKTFIASKTLLFDAPANPAKYDCLTIHQLGKFVAICLHWPLLLADLDNERDLLSRLQKLALANIEPADVVTHSKLTVQLRLSETPTVVAVTDSLVRWYQRKPVREFLRSRLFTADGIFVDDDTRKEYSLEKLDVNKLLQVSPVKKPIARDQSPATTESKPPSTGSNGQTQVVTAADTSATYPKIYGAQ